MKNFKELAKQIPSARQSKIESNVRRTLQLMTLHELRRARKMNQTDVAEQLDVNQGGVSKIESRTDLKISTLQDYVEALGGRLEVRAVFPDQEVALQFAGKN